MDDMLAVFDLVDAIKTIVKCKNQMALNALKKLINDRIMELKAIAQENEQNTQKPEQTPPLEIKGEMTEGDRIETGPIKPVIVIEQKTDKTEQKEKKQKSPRSLFNSDQIIGYSGTLTLYKPVVDAILEKTSDSFKLFDATKIIQGFLLSKGKVVTDRTALKYAYCYLKRMVADKTVFVDHDGYYKKKIENNIDTVVETDDNGWSLEEEEIIREQFFKIGVDGIINKGLIKNRTAEEIRDKAKFMGCILK